MIITKLYQSVVVSLQIPSLLSLGIYDKMSSMDTPTAELVTCKIVDAKISSGMVAGGRVQYDSHSAFDGTRYVAVLSGSWRIDLDLGTPVDGQCADVVAMVNGRTREVTRTRFTLNSSRFSKVILSVPGVVAGDVLGLKIWIDGTPLDMIKSASMTFTRLGGGLMDHAQPWAAVTDWTKYRHGFWRRIGDEIECKASAPILPAGMIPACPAHVLEAVGNPCYYIRVRIKGWESNVVMSSDPDWRIRR